MYEPDDYDTHCPTCDSPEPIHTPTCAVVHVYCDMTADCTAELHSKGCWRGELSKITDHMVGSES